jgi:hypothetical protein
MRDRARRHDGHPRRLGRRRLALTLLGASAATLLLVEAAWAAFGAQTANEANTITAAADFCPGPQTVNVAASADSWVNQSSPTRNYGNSTQLEVRARAGRVRRTLINFALPAPPPGCSLTQVTLRLYASTSTAGRTIEAVPLTGAWTETGVNWNNQPGTGTPVASSPSGAGWRSWDVTAAVQNAYASPSTYYGFLLRDSVETSATSRRQVYVSRTGAAANRPVLVVTFD